MVGKTVGLKIYLVVRRIRPHLDLIVVFSPEPVGNLYSGRHLGFLTSESEVKPMASGSESSDASNFGRLRVFCGDKCSKRRFAPLARLPSRFRMCPARLGM